MTDQIITGFTIKDYLSAGPVFYVGLGLLLLANLVTVTVTSIYLRKRRFPQAAVFFALTLAMNLGFYFMAKAKLQGDAGVKPAQNVVMPDPGPPQREFDFLKKHRITRDPHFATYNAVDEEGVIFCLRSGEPPQIYDSSFQIMMGKEGMNLDSPEKMMEFARFIILLYYRESEPVYFQSPGELADFLKRRTSSAQKNLGNRIGQIMEKETAKVEKEGIKVEKPGDIPALKNAPKDSLRYCLGLVSPPGFEKDWDEGNRVRLFTYSLRHDELAGWEFKIFPDARVEMEKIFSFISKNSHDMKKEKPPVR